MKNEIIGRNYEKQELERIFQSREAEFVAVYGRRRVGKTYLIKNFFADKDCVFFYVSGKLKAPKRQQITSFMDELKDLVRGLKKKKIMNSQDLLLLHSITEQRPVNWTSAFHTLNVVIDSCAKAGKKFIIFLDEFPWMATKKSDLLQALDWFWNRHWSSIPQVKLIICGSAASWIIENILNNKGGLHNRVTTRLPIDPFNLAETAAFLKSKGIKYDNYQILQLYMCIGGIPFYLKGVKKGLSATQNINDMCFKARGTLSDEFNNLFSSLFSESEMHETIIKLIASKREGMTREEIEDATSKGGRLTIWLKELEHAGFIIALIPQNKQKGVYYKLIDEYTLFYLTWISRSSQNKLKSITSKYWENMSQSQAWKTWAGYAYEAICFKHLDNISEALRIPEGAGAYNWRYSSKKNSKEQGAQIDLLFDRPDGVISICEIKYSNGPYKIDKEYAKKLQNKVEVYKKAIKTNKQIFISMITTFGLTETMYSEELIASEARMEDLFK